MHHSLLEMESNKVEWALIIIILSIDKYLLNDHLIVEQQYLQHSSSSDLSGQSDSPLQSNARSIHNPVPQRNCDSRQVRFSAILPFNVKCYFSFGKIKTGILFKEMGGNEIKIRIRIKKKEIRNGINEVRYGGIGISNVFLCSLQVNIRGK